MKRQFGPKRGLERCAAPFAGLYGRTGRMRLTSLAFAQRPPYARRADA